MNIEQTEALRWWYRNSSAELTQQGEALRNDALQHVFGLKRQIEVSQRKSETPEREEVQAWLNALDTLYHSLDEASAKISELYSSESLVLRLSLFIQDWQNKHPDPAVSLKLTEVTSRENQFDNNVIFYTFKGIIRLCTEENHPEALQLSLTTRGEHTVLEVQIIGEEAPLPHLSKASQQATYLAYLETIFQVFTGGACESTADRAKRVWYFQLPA